jgi:hypothetical protein
MNKNPLEDAELARLERGKQGELVVRIDESDEPQFVARSQVDGSNPTRTG